MSTPQASRIARLAWLIAFVVPLVLATTLLVAAKSRAAPAPAAIPFLFEEFEEEGEGEGDFEAPECEEAEIEFEEGELTRAEADRICEEEAEEEDEEKKKASGSSAVAPEECTLRSAQARLVAFDSHDDLRLTVGYTTWEPTASTLEYGLFGGKGSLHLGTVKRQLGRSGVIRLTRALTDAEMDKVDAAGHFVVQLHVAGSPASCRRFETEQLNVKHASKSRAIWSQTK